MTTFDQRAAAGASGHGEGERLEIVPQGGARSSEHLRRCLAQPERGQPTTWGGPWSPPGRARLADQAFRGKRRDYVAKQRDQLGARLHRPDTLHCRGSPPAEKFRGDLLLQSEQIGEQLASLAQAALVEGVRVLRTLQADVDRARETAGPSAGEIAHMRYQSRGRIYRAGA